MDCEKEEDAEDEEKGWPPTPPPPPAPPPPSAPPMLPLYTLVGCGGEGKTCRYGWPCDGRGAAGREGVKRAGQAEEEVAGEEEEEGGREGS